MLSTVVEMKNVELLTPGLGHECVCKEGYIKFDDVCVGK